MSTEQSHLLCLARLNPYAEFSYDGLVLNPLEVVFVKVKGFQVQGGWLSAQSAMTYDRWLSSEVSENPQKSLFNSLWKSKQTRAYPEIIFG